MIEQVSSELCSDFHQKHSSIEKKLPVLLASAFEASSSWQGSKYPSTSRLQPSKRSEVGCVSCREFSQPFYSIPLYLGAYSTWSGMSAWENDRSNTHALTSILFDLVPLPLLIQKHFLGQFTLNNLELRSKLKREGIPVLYVTTTSMLQAGGLS